MTRFILLLTLALFAGCESDSNDDGADMGAGGEGGHAHGGEGGHAHGGEGGHHDEELPLIGTWTDGFGTHEISDERWMTTYEGSEPSVFHIVEVEVDAGYLVAHNAEDNMFNPGAFSRFDWATVDEQLYFCQSIFDAESLEAARMAMADASDPANGGCGAGEEAFPWSPLNPVE